MFGLRRPDRCSRGCHWHFTDILSSRPRTPKQEQRKLLKTHERLKVTWLFKKSDPGLCLTKSQAWEKRALSHANQDPRGMGAAAQPLCVQGPPCKPAFHGPSPQRARFPTREMERASMPWGGSQGCSASTSSSRATSAPVRPSPRRAHCTLGERSRSTPWLLRMEQGRRGAHGGGGTGDGV